MYKTTNGGGNWGLDNDGMGAIAINALAKHPTNPLLIYAATDGGNGGGVFWSQTGGDTWEPRRTGMLAGLIVSTIALAPSNLQVLYASSGGALYKTTDSGATWAHVNLGNGFNLISAIFVDPSNAQTVYVAAHGLFKNTSGGSGPWTSLSNGLPSGQVYAIVRDPSTPQTFYVAVDGQFTNQGGIYKSTTGGANWRPMDTGLANFERADFTALAIAPSGSTLYAGALGIFHYQSLPAQLAVFRPTKHRWLYDLNADGLYNGCPPDRCTSPLGMTDDLPVANDWDSIGLSTIGVFRPSNGRWYIDSGNRVWDNCKVDTCLGPFGSTGDLPVSGDWFGLGFAAIGVFRPSTGRWYLDNGNGIDESCNVDMCLGEFGQPDDLPVVGDWRGKGRTFIGVFRPSTGQFLLDWNGNGRLDACTIDKCVTFGESTDLPVAGDWFGLGYTSIGVYRPSTGLWYLDNGNFVWQGCLVEKCVGPFGKQGDLTSCGGMVESARYCVLHLARQFSGDAVHSHVPLARPTRVQRREKCGRNHGLSFLGRLSLGLALGDVPWWGGPRPCCHPPNSQRRWIPPPTHGLWPRSRCPLSAMPARWIPRSPSMPRPYTWQV